MSNRFVLALLVGAVLPAGAVAQSTTYRVHNEASTTAGFKQLKATPPDVAATVLQTANLQSTAAGEKKVAEFDTLAGVPAVAGKIPSGATVSAQVWMRKTAAFGAMTPRVRVRLNNATGTTLCTATGSSALTTTLAVYTLNCATTAAVTLTASTRLYVWVGVNLTTTSSAGAFRGELGLEGVAGANYDSHVTVPNALPAPTISSLSPSSGAVGASVTISGTNFRDQQLSSVVRFFNNRTATVTSWTNSAIVATVPAGTTSGAVTVTVAGTASNGPTFTINPPPSVGGLSPTSGSAGTLVTITGSNFGLTQGTSAVTFNGTPATISSWANGQIAATVPATATSGNVVVQVNGVNSNGVAFTVSAAAPTFSIGAGTYPAGQLVTITSATAGATIYYTLNGQDPTTADSPLGNGGTVPVGNYTIKARASAPGLGSSTVTQAAYQRDSSACTYVVRAGALSLGGTASAGQITVTPSSEFCDWTATASQPWLTLGATGGTGAKALAVLAAQNVSGALRNASITVGATVVPVVQNVVPSCSFAVAPSAVAAGAAAGGGALSVTASDPACAWVAASDVPWLTLGTTSGVGNGSAPFTYTANAGSTVRWSGVTVANQQVAVTQASGSALTIAGGTTPPANALGWHREDVTVVFSCAGPGNINCASPVNVTTDGVQDITGQASNDLSQSASATVTVRIDRVAPALDVTFPKANSLVQPGPVTISGSAVDGLSDPVVVCDGVLATVSGGVFACSVTVGSGTTNVTVVAVDAAGNQRSLVVPVSTTDAIVTPPTNLRVSPQNVTMAVGQRWRFAMLDDLDRSPVDVVWTRTNQSLSTVVVANGQIEVTAVATGTTILTASWRGLTATTTVTIVSANAFVAGTTIWNAPPLTVGATVTNVVKGARTPAGETFLFAIERGATDRIRMFTADGAERASFQTGSVVSQLSADPIGGAVAMVGSSLVRISVNGGIYPLAADAVAPGFAIDPGGAVHYVRNVNANDARLESLDIGFGKGRVVDLPGVSTVGVPTVMADGAVVVPFVGDGFRLLVARPNGVDSLYYVIDPQYPVTSYRAPYKAIPDGQGGYYVAYDESGQFVGYRAMLAHLDSTGSPDAHAIVGGGQHGVNSGSWFPWSSTTSLGQLSMGPVMPGWPDSVIATINKIENGQYGVATTEVSGGYAASTSWRASDRQTQYLATEFGFVGAYPDGLMWGPSPDYDLMTLSNPRPYRSNSWLGGTASGLAEMIGPSFLPSISQWPTPGGGTKGGNTATSPTWVHFLPLTNYNDPKKTPTLPMKTPEEVEKDIRTKITSTTSPVRGSHKFHLRAQANPWTYADEVGYSGNDAVAFFGHSTFTSAVGATGMVFFDDWILIKQGYPPPPTSPPFPERVISISTIPSSARLIVIANCDVRDLFKGLWSIGPGRALIYTRNTTDGKVDLKAATIAWGEMMKELSKPGTTVAQAVAVANNFINTQFRPVGHPEHFEFAFDQGGDVRLVR